MVGVYGILVILSQDYLVLSICIFLVCRIIYLSSQVSTAVVLTASFLLIALSQPMRPVVYCIALLDYEHPLCLVGIHVAKNRVLRPAHPLPTARIVIGERGTSM